VPWLGQRNAIHDGEHKPNPFVTTRRTSADVFRSPFASGPGRRFPITDSDLAQWRARFEELPPANRALAQYTVDRRSDGPRTPGLDPANGHARVLGLYRDAGSHGGDVLLKPVGDLDRQAFLNL
jgi:hypothetical protein